jgi:Membrane dipeptidase (Peptidase family M19)
MRILFEAYPEWREHRHGRRAATRMQAAVRRGDGGLGTADLMSDEIRLAAQVGRVPSMVVPLDAEQERRFADFVRNLALVDMHQHTLVLPESIDDFPRYADSHGYTWGYAAAHAGRWTLVGVACNMIGNAYVVKGGVVRVTAVPNSLSDDPQQDIGCVLDHYDYLFKLVGEDHVGIGADSVVGDHVAYTRLLMRRDEPPPPAAYLNGLESPLTDSILSAG